MKSDNSEELCSQKEDIMKEKKWIYSERRFMRTKQILIK